MSGSNLVTTTPSAVPAEPQTTPQPGLDHGDQSPAQASSLPLDPDELALAQARAELEAEQAAANGQPAPATTPAPEPATPPAQGAPKQQQPSPMVPKARFDEVNRQLRSLQEQVIYLQGALHARTQQAQAPQQQGQQQPAPTQQQANSITDLIASEQARVLDAAGKYDQGDMSLADFTKVKLEVEGNIASLRERALAQQIQAMIPKPPPPGAADAALLQQQKAELEQAHPWVGVLNDAELGFLADMAKAEFKALGQPIGTGSAETMRLRKRVAQLADKYGPDWYPNQMPAAAAQQPARNQASQPAAAPAQPVPRALAAATQHPPSTLNVGTTAEPGVITAEQIERMSTDEIADLPDSIRVRFQQAHGSA